MTTLSTHDTKRGEDVRARLDVLAEVPRALGRRARATCAMRASTGHGPFDSLLWQAVDRLVAGVARATARLRREGRARSRARRRAGGIRMRRSRRACTRRSMRSFDDAELGRAGRRASSPRSQQPAGRTRLSAKLLQLTAPGVPDVYQGSELWETSLVDPDNRRPVDFAERGGCCRARRRLRAGDCRPSTRRAPRSCWSPPVRCACGATGRSSSPATRR